ncbi:MAG: hypothetical protein QXD13_01655 [Candidatus Pacearchaeota archaeon]
MKIKLYVDRLNNSKEFADFQKKYSDAFMIAGFFILDLEQGNNLHQIDYYIPSEKKIAAFTLDGGVTMQLLEAMGRGSPEKLDIKTNIDLDALHGILEDEMKNRNITDEVKKIIAIIQNIDGKKVWNINCILSGMNILKAHIEDESKTVLKMERSSIMDYIKKVPAADLKKLKLPRVEVDGEGEGAEESSEEVTKKESKEQLKEKIKKLQELESAIEKEKEEYEKELKEEAAGKESKSKGKKPEKKQKAK